MTDMNAKFERVVEALLSESTVEEAARVSKVSARTIRRWLKDDADFVASYRAARRRLFDATITRIVGLCSTAVETLEAILRDPAAPRSAKLAAIRIVLERSFAAQEIDLEERLRQIEEELARLEVPS